MSHDDFAFEVAPGLPAPLPPGEEILWQGRPQTWRLAVESVSIRWVLGYFVLLAIWRVAVSLAGMPPATALATALPLVVLGGAAVLLLWGFCWLQARATVYTVTTSRVILRIGAALQLTLQVPYSRMLNVALDLRPGGTGTLAFELDPNGGAQMSYLSLWPHVRPWHLKQPQPAFRAIADAETVAHVVADAAESQLAKPQVMRAEPAQPAIHTEPGPFGTGAGPAVPAE